MNSNYQANDSKDMKETDESAFRAAYSIKGRAVAHLDINRALKSSAVRTKAKTLAASIKSYKPK